MSQKVRPPFPTPVRGQASVEYILLIGLIVIFLIAALFVFRNSVIGFIGSVSEWFGGQAVTAPPSTPPNPPLAAAPPTPPSPTPTPTPKPTPAEEDWSLWLQGRWCGPSQPWTGNRTGSGQINGYPVRSIGPDRFRFTNPTNPNDYTDYERVSGNSYRLTYRNLTPNMPVSAPWSRC